MSDYLSMSKEELKKELEKNLKLYDGFKSQNLKLNMARGKPCSQQLDISNGILENDFAPYKAEDGTDCRNYGLLAGIPEAKKLFAEILNVPEENIILGSNSSLNLMYDFIMRAFVFGVSKKDEPWSRQGKIKFLCPVPGYDRHFAICSQLGIEMINIKMNDDGPDMDMVRQYVENDKQVKGIWCVPKYSNPDGIVYSDEVIREFASLKPKASDFRIFWDNAYIVHHLYEDIEIADILDECKKAGNENMAYVFASTSKISFPGAGVAMFASSAENIAFAKEVMAIQTIGPDKLNQLRHVKYFKNAGGIYEHMKKHAEILRPKFEMVIDILNKELGNLNIAKWTNPKGGYFISFYALNGTAKRIGELCKNAGLVMTAAGATFPYGNDPDDSNLRIAPTFPPLDELKTAMELFTVAVKIAAIEKLI